MSPPGMRAVLRVHEDRPEWRDRAACRNEPKDTFYAERGEASTQLDAARVLCSSCPVKAPCLQYALDTGQGHGMWGGTTPKERRRLRKQLGVRSRVLHRDGCGCAICGRATA